MRRRREVVQRQVDVLSFGGVDDERAAESVVVGGVEGGRTEHEQRRRRRGGGGCDSWAWMSGGRRRTGTVELLR